MCSEKEHFIYSSYKKGKVKSRTIFLFSSVIQDTLSCVLQEKGRWWAEIIFPSSTSSPKNRASIEPMSSKVQIGRPIQDLDLVGPFLGPNHDQLTLITRPSASHHHPLPAIHHVIYREIRCLITIRFYFKFTNLPALRPKEAKRAMRMLIITKFREVKHRRRIHFKKRGGGDEHIEPPYSH